MAFPPPDQARQELDELLTAIPDLTAPSTTKFDRVVAWAARGHGGEDVYAVWVSKAANLKVRLDQRGRTSRIGFAVLKTEDDLLKCIRTGRKLVGPGRPCEAALAFCVRPAAGSRWTVAAVIRRSGESAASPLEAAFPDAEIVEPIVPATVAQPPNGDLDQLADDLFVDRAWLHDVVWLLRDKRGVVFYGPPGTGKTYIALKLAEHLQPDPELRRFVQLHPSYGYEDFFEGFRPRQSSGGGLDLVLTPGPLRELCHAGSLRPDADTLLLLDEMNRGNLPKVFGELYFALEYRDRPVRLMYSGDDGFRLPERLSVMGTMNTADRSIALLDQALRRRFHFVGLFPGEHVVDGMLARFLEARHPELAWVADVVAAANDLLGERNTAVGPSHFMRKELDDKVVARIWKHSILPTIEEHYFGDETRLAEFQLEALRDAVVAEGADADAT